MRQFKTGATRNDDSAELDYEGFFHPYVVETFARYMHENRTQADGKIRDSDNWQKGIDLDSYMKSGHRHFMDWWKEHRGEESREGMEKALCGLMFNVMGYLYQMEMERRSEGTVVDMTHSDKADWDHLSRITRKLLECNAPRKAPVNKPPRIIKQRPVRNGSEVASETRLQESRARLEKSIEKHLIKNQNARSRYPQKLSDLPLYTEPWRLG